MGEEIKFGRRLQDQGRERIHQVAVIAELRQQLSSILESGPKTAPEFQVVQYRNTIELTHRILGQLLEKMKSREV